MLNFVIAPVQILVLLTLQGESLVILVLLSDQKP